MLERFAKYFLDNRKITLVAITAIAFFGTLSYVLLPKQYNPSIVAPAFEISLPVRGYSSADASRFVVQEIENRLAELEGIDDLYGYAGDERASVMASFKVGTDAEKAKARLYDKLSSNYALRPYGVEAMDIRSIDPEDLPQISFAVRYTGTGLTMTEAGIYVRAVANSLRDQVKSVAKTSTLDVVGGYSNQLTVEVDPDKARGMGTEVSEIVGALKSRVGYRAVGSLSDGKSSTLVALDGGGTDEESLKNLVVGYAGGGRAEVAGTVSNGAPIYLRDVAKIVRGPSEATQFAFYSDKNGTYPSAFFGVSKAKGSNAVTVVEDVVKVIDEAKKTLPGDVSVETVANEGETARHATNELLFHLFVSIAIVFGVLVLFLGLRNAANAAFCIPMVLGIVFVVAFVFGLDINRITLFALILSLGILVDDSIVVVENNARHLADRVRDGRTKKQAILDSVREVGVSIVLSTITRIMSFLGMFAVTGMMGDYMKPIPVFAAIALTASLFVAFSINPFMAHALDRGHGHHEEKDAPILAHYANFLKKFIGSGKKEKAARRWLKPAFWVSLMLVVSLPIAMDVFRARMLPKANKEQAYLWINLPRDAKAAESEKAAELAADILLDRKSELPEDLRIATSVSDTSGERFLPDFANLFRGSQNRRLENQSSLRVNLSEEREISSEEYVIRVRPILRDRFLEKYPDAKIRLLEDPPGPPTMATFHVKLKGEEGLPTQSLVRFAESVQGVVKSIAAKKGIEDLENSLSSAQPKLRVKLDNEKMSERGVDTASVEAALASVFSENGVGMLETSGKSPEAENVVVTVARKYREDPSAIGAVTVKNRMGQTVRIDEIAMVEPDYA
ncbi:MAG: efflux RND transporter permease subunit [Patescibacteria group bacterium]